jgi:hypothetical protein
VSDRNTNPEVSHLDIAPFIERMAPEAFLETSALLLEDYRRLPSYYGDGPADQAHFALAGNLVETVLSTALDQVHTNVKGQDQAVTAVEMLRGIGSTPTSYSLHTAISCAASFHAVQQQLISKAPSPILSVFVNDYRIDPHCGVTIQTARSKGKPRWRHDPYRDEGGLPEVVIPVPDLTSPTRSKSEERAILATRHDQLSISKLAGAIVESAIVFDGRATVLTNQHEPKYLLPPKKGHEYNWKERTGDVGGENYDSWLYDEFGVDGTMPSGLHFVAVGDLAIQRLVTRLQEEVLPYMSDSSPAGAPEAKRLTHLLTLASDAIRLMHEPATLSTRSSIAHDTWTSLVTDLRTTLLRRNIDIPANLGDSDAPEWIKLCHKTGVLPTLNLEAVARRTLVSVRQVHEVHPLTADELLDAIRGELHQSMYFAQVSPEQG